MTHIPTQAASKAQDGVISKIRRRRAGIVGKTKKMTNILLQSAYVVIVESGRSKASRGLLLS